MKLLTLNFLTCARKVCKAVPEAFPLHPREAELEEVELDLNVLFVKNILPRLEWDAMRQISKELGLPELPEDIPEESALTDADGEPTQTMLDLHKILMETCITSGKLACGSCGHEYHIKEGIANFLLPSHLV